MGELLSGVMTQHGLFIQLLSGIAANAQVLLHGLFPIPVVQQTHVQRKILIALDLKVDAYDLYDAYASSFHPLELSSRTCGPRVANERLRGDEYKAGCGDRVERLA